MKKNTYMRLLSGYYAFEDDIRIELGYAEGNDTLRLAIGPRRNRLMENIDVNYLYLLVFKREEGEFGYSLQEYRKYEVEPMEREYVIDLQTLLKDLQLNYRELDSKEFSRTKKFEKRTSSECIYPYAYRHYRKCWMDIGVYFIDADYCRNAFFIGDREVCSIGGETFSDDADAFKFLMESCEKKTKMTIDDFSEFLKDARYMNFLQINFDGAKIKKSNYSDVWSYEAWVEKGDEKELVTYSIDSKNEKAGVILYRMLSCTEYEQFNNLVSKIKMLGLG